MIIASRSSLPSVYTGSGGNVLPRSTIIGEGVDRPPACPRRSVRAPLRLLESLSRWSSTAGSVVEDQQVPQRWLSSADSTARSRYAAPTARTFGSVSAMIGLSWETGALCCSGTDTQAEIGARQVDREVVGAGEADRGDEVTRR